jgi:hypothetical protein
MTIIELLIAAFAILAGGLLLPLSYGMRMAIFLALAALAVLTFIGAGVGHYVGRF